tara:strand:- start:1474 stop:2568 length:1095 start_codon:yes stop_codon:yes gene_type:complete
MSDKSQMKSAAKTKKYRNNSSRKSKKEKEVWNMIDKEIGIEKDMTCIYEKEDIVNTNKCTECNSRLFCGESGFLFCSNTSCGILYKDKLDFGAEWRYYGAEDNNNVDPTRCGMPVNPLLLESSFGCKVMCGRSSSYEMRRIKRYTEWQSMPYNEKSKYDDFQIITLIARNSGIPKIIIDDAVRYYVKLSEAKTFRGLNRDGILAASIYISFSTNKNPRTPKEIATIFRLDNTSTTRGCKNAMNILNELEMSNNCEEQTLMTKTTPSTFIARYCSKLNINQELTRLCMFIANKVKTQNLIPENTPHSIAAGIMYYVSLNCNLNVTKKDINEASQISEVTINKCYKKLEIYKDILIPQTLIQKYNV